MGSTGLLPAAAGTRVFCDSDPIADQHRARRAEHHRHILACHATGKRQGLQDEGGGEAGRVQIHRALLQHAKDALVDRL